MPSCPPGSEGPECTKKKQIPSQNARALEQKTLDFAKQKNNPSKQGRRNLKNLGRNFFWLGFYTPILAYEVLMHTSELAIFF